MVRSFLLALLAGCGGTPAPEPPPVDAPEPPSAQAEQQAPTAAPVPPGGHPASLLEAVFTTHSGVVTAMRLLMDGTVEQALGDTRGVTWRHLRTIAAVDLEDLQVFLDSREIADLPPVLPEPPGAPGQPVRAVWRLQTTQGERVIRADVAQAVRVPAFDRIERTMRGSHPVPVIHTRWLVAGDDAPSGRLVPCDPVANPVLRGVTHALVDGTLPPADPASAAGEPLLRVDWGVGTRAWQTLVHGDGLVVRVDELGRSTAARLPSDRLAGLRGALGEVRWDDAVAACR